MSGDFFILLLNKILRIYQYLVPWKENCFEKGTSFCKMRLFYFYDRLPTPHR